MACDCGTDFNTCDNKDLTTQELFKMLLAQMPSLIPALRVCVSNADDLGGLRVDDFEATPGQTVFVLANPIRLNAQVFIDGAIQQGGYGAYIVGGTNVTLPAQAEGSQITILS